MQAQRTRTKAAITSKQSLLAVKSLLTAGFGCIAYLRDLLPDASFCEARLMSDSADSGSFESLSQEQASRADRGVKVKMVARGFSDEGNKLLDYLEKGIFDALERQYLKSFIFAIYLDDQDPNNIIEAYTFNFSYANIPGTNVSIPIMSLEDDLTKLSLNGKAGMDDPVAASSLMGEVPTLRDVKKSMRTLIKRLVTATELLGPLPKRRFATFKLFYMDHTPDEYEPPEFRPGDPEMDRFIFTTHGKSQMPEKISVGSVLTPFHGVQVQVESITSFLPSVEDDRGNFSGLVMTPRGNRSAPKTKANDAVARSKQTEIQLQDAMERNVVWDAEPSTSSSLTKESRYNSLSDADAEGEPDQDFVNDSGIALHEPVGMRDSDGSIIPIVRTTNVSMDIDLSEAQFGGLSEDAPSRVSKLNPLRTRVNGGAMEPTQLLESTQILPETDEGRRQTFIYNTEEMSLMSRGIDTQFLKEHLLQNRNNSAMMDCSDVGELLEMETQIARQPIDAETQSYGGSECVTGRQNLAPCTAAADEMTKMPQSRKHAETEVHCACELTEGDDIVQCEGPCQNWYHLWCMGYHSMEDKQIPVHFTCLGCMLHDDEAFDLIKASFSDIMSNLRDLAIFRRAIKFAEMHEPDSFKAFKKIVECSRTAAEQQWKRLEAEGFVLLQVVEVDPVGLVETRTTRARSQIAKKNKGKATEVSKYVFNFAIVNTPAYQDYFDPGGEAEKRMLELQLNRRGKTRGNLRRTEVMIDSHGQIPVDAMDTSCHDKSGDCGLGTDPKRLDAPDTSSGPIGNALSCTTEEDTQESQTQEDSQYVEPYVLKRKNPVEGQKSITKKIKISVGGGIDMEA